MVAMVASCFNSIAYAQFIENRNQWLSIADGQREGFAMGAISASFYIVASDADQNLFNAKVRECLKAIEFNSLNGAKLITQEYEPVENWSLPALLILLNGVNKLCRSYIEDV